MDKLIKAVDEHNFRTDDFAILQANLLELLEKLEVIRDLVEWDSLQETFEYKVAVALQDITNFDKLAKVVGHCYAVRLPYVKVW